jgi:hypothetical protein
MEVHHHSHTERKKWTHYLWEFLMLFLAVFCGFFAEYQLEHVIEKQREKQYINSLINDLTIDATQLYSIIENRNHREVMLDSLMILMHSNKAENGMDIYYYNSFASRMDFRFNSDDGTLQQLKNAGNLRLIHKQKVRDSIMAYDVVVRTRQKSDEEETIAMETYRIIAQEIFDGAELEKTRDSLNNVHRLNYNPQLKDNKEAIFKLIYRIHMLRNFNRIGRRDSKILLRKAINLVQQLRQEYNLSEETKLEK